MQFGARFLVGPDAIVRTLKNPEEARHRAQAALAGLAYPMLFGHGTSPVPGSGLAFRRAAQGAVPGYGAPDQLQEQWNQQDPPVSGQPPQQE